MMQTALSYDSETCKDGRVEVHRLILTGTKKEAKIRSYLGWVVMRGWQHHLKTRKLFSKAPLS